VTVVSRSQPGTFNKYRIVDIDAAAAAAQTKAAAATVRVVGTKTR